ncbi:MAG: hypothetical protein ABH886_08180 [Candidatus Desantisbacteria bacterium]
MSTLTQEKLEDIEKLGMVQNCLPQGHRKETTPAPPWKGGA